MRAFFIAVTIAPLFWAFTWLIVFLVMRLPLDSLLRKLFALVYVPAMIVTIGTQAPIIHVGHPRGAHMVAFVFLTAADFIPAVAIGWFLNRNQEQRIKEGRLG